MLDFSSPKQFPSLFASLFLIETIQPEFTFESVIHGIATFVIIFEKATFVIKSKKAIFVINIFDNKCHFPANNNKCRLITLVA